MIIVMLNHAVGVLVALLSLLYVNLFIPREMMNANAAIPNYTRDQKQQVYLDSLHHGKIKRKIYNTNFNISRPFANYPASFFCTEFRKTGYDVLQNGVII